MASISNIYDIMCLMHSIKIDYVITDLRGVRYLNRGLWCKDNVSDCGLEDSRFESCLASSIILLNGKHWSGSCVWARLR